MAGRTEDYAVIGNCETMALVGRDGSIDWLCLPRFDSAACFAALLGDAGNKRWQIAPQAAAQTTRQYRGGTLILETMLETASGSMNGPFPGSRATKIPLPCISQRRFRPGAARRLWRGDGRAVFRAHPRPGFG